MFKTVTRSSLILAGAFSLSVQADGVHIHNHEEVKPGSLPVFDCLIEPGQTIEISSPVQGVVQEMYVDRGDRVESDTPLSSLNAAVQLAEVELAKTRAASTVEIELQRENVLFSRRLQSRNQELFHKSAISTHDMDRFETEQRIAVMQERQARQAYNVAQLEYKRALELLNQRTIKSPISGVVTETYKSVGEYVDEEPLLRLVQLDPLNIEIIVEAKYWNRFSAGQSAMVTPLLNGMPQAVANVERIDPVIDSASDTFRVQLSLPNPDLSITAGLKCVAQFDISYEGTIPVQDNEPTAPIEGPVQPEGAGVSAASVAASDKAINQQELISKVYFLPSGKN